MLIASHFRVLAVAVLWLCASVFFADASLAQEKEVLGWVEKVRVYPGDIVVHAKLDTGADYSSLGAENIVEFERDGENFVRFTVRNRYGKQVAFEIPVRRTSFIKRHSGRSSRRAVVRLGLCVGTHYMEEEVSLVARDNFSHQMLVGRSFLAGKALVDSAVNYTTEPNCQGAPQP